MATDDDTGWTAVLLDSWGPHVRDAVVDRVERATVGRRGPLIRTLADPTSARYAWEEHLHGLVLAAIRAEVGADLEELGSQAAWACYDEVWSALGGRWRDGGGLAHIPAVHEQQVQRLLAHLSASGAEAAGADIATVPVAPLVLAGEIRIDVEGLWAHLALEDVDDRERAVVRALVDLAT